MLHDYSETPVFFDFETQSAADLPEIGGRLYAECPSTRVLSLSCLIDRELHIWIPENVAAPYRGELYLPPEYRPLYDTLTLHQTDLLPHPIEKATRTRVFAAHNLCGFDRFIWEECVAKRGLGSLPRRWADTLYLARLAGLPRGGLDAVAEQLIGTSKDAAKKIVMPLTRGEWVNGEPEYPRVQSGMIDPLVRYCSVDTLILAQLWEKFSDLIVESDAIQAHQNINDRGIAVDLSLSTRLVIVAAEASRRAAEEIEELTKGELYGDTATRKGNLRSTEKVHAWLKKQGVEIVMEVAGETGTVKKRTLRKDVVEQYLANPLLMLGEDTEVSLEVLKNFNADVLPLVTKVLRLRVTATRITSAKAEKMGKRACADGRIYDLHTYHKAHTGRASSQGVQIHNMPRGKKGVKVGKLLTAHENGEWPKDAAKAYDFIYAECLDPVERQKGLTVDDALSSLIRPCFLAAKGHKLGIADYAAIECRGIAWIAGETKLLDAFAAGRDVYCEFASILYGKTVTKDMKVERQVGKTVILGCGYGMGVEKFAITAALQNIDLKKAGTSAEQCVETYRAAYQKIAGSYSGSFNGRAARRGGIWEQLNTAAMKAVVEGGRHTAGKCHFVYAGGVLRVTLPSGRELRYNNCRVEDRIPSYAIALGLDVKARPTIVYVGERGETSMYGGKWAENCLSGNTRVVTSNGVKTLDTVTRADKLWDGVSWVSHDGLINKGEQEVIEWKGIQLTADHLMHDGNSWCESRNAGLEPWQFLKLGVHSEILRSLLDAAEKGRNLHVSASAEMNAKSILADLCGMKLNSVNLVDGEKLTLIDEIRQRVSYLIWSYAHSGAIDIQAWYHGVVTNLVERIRTTVDVVSQYIQDGLSTGMSFCDTVLRSHGGMNWGLIWTESITTGTMYLGIFDWLTEQVTARTNGTVSISNVSEENIHCLNSIRNYVPTGNHGEQYTTTYRTEKPPKKSYRCTVYDILNSGPNNRFTVLSDSGEVIVHNCVQAICRDILYTALIRGEMFGIPFVADVHDETIGEYPEAVAAEYLQKQCILMSHPPEWADGFPISVEGYTSLRYVKEAAIGEYQVTAINGVVTHAEMRSS